MTDPCEDVCYALDFVFLTPTSKKKHGDNWERAQNTDEFLSDLYAEIRYRRVKRIRIHVGGDFFSVPYLQAWSWVAERCKTTTFLFYTRAWRAAEMRVPLIAMAACQRLRILVGGPRHRPCDFPVGRRAFLCTNFQDELLVPSGVLVFRHQTRTIAKFINGSWVCAKEQGTKTGVTCSSYKQCVKPDPWPVSSEGRGRDGSASGNGLKRTPRLRPRQGRDSYIPPLTRTHKHDRLRTDS